MNCIKVRYTSFDPVSYEITFPSGIDLRNFTGYASIGLKNIEIVGGDVELLKVGNFQNANLEIDWWMFFQKLLLNESAIYCEKIQKNCLSKGLPE